MRVYQLAKTTGTGNQAAIDLESQGNRDECLFTVELTSTGSVTLEGRIDNEGSWITIAGPYTVDTITPIAFVPALRLAIASNAGTVIAKVAVS